MKAEYARYGHLGKDTTPVEIIKFTHKIIEGDLASKSAATAIVVFPDNTLVEVALSELRLKPLIKFTR